MKNKRLRYRQAKSKLKKRAVIDFKSSVLLLLVLWLSACGNKGDLYLPDEEPTEQREQID